MCVAKLQSENYECRPYDQMTAATRSRFNQPAVTASVCGPGSRGWIGDHCFADADCGNGTSCRGATTTVPGTCSEACTQYCPDEPGYADTFCAAVPAFGTGGSCVRQCSPAANGAECPSDMTCTQMARNGSPLVKKSVCVPR